MVYTGLHKYVLYQTIQGSPKQVESVLGPYSVQTSLSGLNDCKLKMDSNHQVQNAHPLAGGAYINRLSYDGSIVTDK